MAWQLQGEWIETCSCDMYCACNFGPQGKASRGWCSAAIGLAIRQGTSDGVDLSNVRVVLAADFPGNFNLGNGVGRVYLDEGMSDDQRREIESILSGQKGGVFEGLGGAFSQMLPSKVARIAVNSGASPSISVAGAGEMTLERMKDQNGNQTQVLNSAVGTGFGLPSSDLAYSRGQWSDPEMRIWESDGGNGAVNSFNWSV